MLWFHNILWTSALSAGRPVFSSRPDSACWAIIMHYCIFYQYLVKARFRHRPFAPLPRGHLCRYCGVTRHTTSRGLQQLILESWAESFKDLPLERHFHAISAPAFEPLPRDNLCTSSGVTWHTTSRGLLQLIFKSSTRSVQDLPLERHFRPGSSAMLYWTDCL